MWLFEVGVSSCRHAPTFSSLSCVVFNRLLTSHLLWIKYSLLIISRKLPLTMEHTVLAQTKKMRTKEGRNTRRVNCPLRDVPPGWRLPGRRRVRRRSARCWTQRSRPLSTNRIWRHSFILIPREMWRGIIWMTETWAVSERKIWGKNWVYKMGIDLLLYVLDPILVITIAEYPLSCFQLTIWSATSLTLITLWVWKRNLHMASAGTAKPRLPPFPALCTRPLMHRLLRISLQR